MFSAPFILNKKSVEWFSDKVISSELPAIIERRNMMKSNSEYIDCIYAGDFYAGIREPDFMLKMFSMMKNPNIILIVLSDCQKEKLENFAKQEMKGRVVVKGRLPEEECNEMFEQADVFINIGNAIDNQLQSKVLNYMNYGKPIINLYKIDNCPTLNYMRDYPLAISIKEAKDISVDDVELAETFIEKSFNSRINFEEIKSVFIKCTPEYVSNNILSAITE